MTQDRPSPVRLYRNRRNGWVAGVCAGIADYFGVSTVPVRVVTAVGLVMFFIPTVIAYIFAAWLIKPAPENLFESKDEEHFWRNVRKEPKDTVHDLHYKFGESERRLRALEAQVTSSEFELRRKFKDLGA